MSKNWKLIEKSKIKNRVSKNPMSSDRIYILLVQVHFFFVTRKRVHLILYIHDQIAYVLPYVNACLANFECKISKFIQLEAFQFCKNYWGKQNYSLVGEGGFLLFRTNYVFILMANINFSPFFMTMTPLNRSVSRTGSR